MEKTLEEQIETQIITLKVIHTLLQSYHLRLTNLENYFIQAEKRYNSDKANKDVQQKANG